MSAALPPGLLSGKPASPYHYTVNRAFSDCEVLAHLLIRVLALIVGLILGVGFFVSFLGGGALGFILTLVIGCGGLFGLCYVALLMWERSSAEGRRGTTLQ